MAHFDAQCTFCQIVNGDQDCFKVYEDEFVMAFLDILPIRAGHLLVIPKKHFIKLTELPDELSAALGRVIPKISRALCIAMKQPDFNVVNNNGYAQIVPHAHFHLVPAPVFGASGKRKDGWASVLGRDELDDEEAKEIVIRIKDALKQEMIERNSLEQETIETNSLEQERNERKSKL